MASQQILRQRQMSTDEVMQDTPDIVTFFIANRAEAQGHIVPEEMRTVAVNDEVASCLRQVSHAGLKNASEVPYKVVLSYNQVDVRFIHVHVRFSKLFYPCSFLYLFPVYNM
jgi:hypothetical protein